MHKIIGSVLALALLAGCASSPKSSSNDSSKSADKGGKSRTSEPSWVANPHNDYSESQYVSAVGYGTDRESAEKNALGALVAVFGQTVKGETVVSTRYTEAVKSGVIEVTEDTDIGRAVTSSYDLETVVGAEIKDTWYDGAKTTYAVAVMDKAKAALLYADLVDTNESSVQKLIQIPQADKNTLDAYARYDLAAAIADENARFLNILSVVSPGSAAARRGSVSKGEDLRTECLRIAQTIPIAVSVANDRNNRIKTAFASVLTKAGFKSGGAGTRYTLSGTLNLTEVELKDNPNVFVRYLVDAELIDTQTGTVLVPYSINGREGHTTLSEAENRAVKTAEKKITADFSQKFAEFLGGLQAK